VVLLGFLCGLAELLLCIHPVYLGAPYAFLMKFLLIKIKKKFKIPLFLFFKKIKTNKDSSMGIFANSVKF